MVNKPLLWVASLVALIALIFLIIGIILIRRTWDDPQRREGSMFWLYLAGVAIFLAALMAGIAAELTPNMCRLPYSGVIIESDRLKAQ